MMNRLTQLLLAASLTAGLGASGPQAPKKIGQEPRSCADSKVEITEVSYCHLVANPEYYKDKLVRTRAVYTSNFEWSRLYDLKCNVEENLVSPSLKCDDEDVCKKMRDQINKTPFGDTSRNLEMVLVGRIRPLKETGQRFGPSGGFRLAFDISCIEEVTPLHEDTLLPLGQR